MAANAQWKTVILIVVQMTMNANVEDKTNAKPRSFLLEKAAFVGLLTLCVLFVFRALPGPATPVAAALGLLLYFGCVVVILFALFLRNPYFVVGLILVIAGITAAGVVAFPTERTVVTTLALASAVLVLLAGTFALLKGIRIHRQQVQQVG